MTKLTKEDYDILNSDFKVAIFWALHSNCVPAFSVTEISKLKAIYKHLGHTLESSSCGHCMLTMMQIIGKEYVEYENELKKAEEHETDGDYSTDGQDEKSSLSEECIISGNDGKEAGRKAKTKKRNNRNKKERIDE